MAPEWAERLVGRWETPAVAHDHDPEVFGGAPSSHPAADAPKPFAAPTAEAELIERARVSGNRLDAAFGSRLLFALGFCGALIFAVLLFDQLGPKTDRAATVTSKFVSHTVSHNHRETSYHVQGTDSVGGTFALDVSASAYDRARSGQRITVSRALLTGRVVEVHDTSWSLSSTTRLVRIFAGFGLLCAAAVAVGLWLYRKSVRGLEPGGRRRSLLVLAAMAVLIVGGMVIWVLVQRHASAISGAIPL